MGLWNNTAYLACDDPDAVLTAIETVAAEAGRVRITPLPREPAPYDPMQYGRGQEVSRWGFAVFPGAPGWTVVKTAPLELLLEGAAPPPLAKLARRLGCDAFQYNLYDGSSSVIVESNRSGRIAVSGYCAQDPTRFYGRMPREDEALTRFTLVDLSDILDEARSRPLPDASGVVIGSALLGRIGRDERLTDLGDRLHDWLIHVGGHPEPLGGEIGFTAFTAPSVEVVAALAAPEPLFFDSNAEHQAISAVFGGGSADEITDNLVSVSHLVPHRPLLQKDGRVLYVETP